MDKQAYETLKSLITSTVNTFPIEEHRNYIIKEGKAKDIEKRVRWDYFWASTKRQGEFMNTLKGLDDCHIDTALKLIFKTI